MLTNIDKLYLKTYDERYGHLRGQELTDAIEEAERQFNQSFPNSMDQRKAVYALTELIQYLTLLHIQETGSLNDVIVMVTGTISPDDGLQEPLPIRAQEYLMDEPTPYWYMDNSRGDWYIAYLDVPVSSDRGAQLRTMFNTSNTAPRKALRPFILERISQN